MFVSGTECHHWVVEFELELARVLPAELPHRDRLIEKGARHLDLISAANAYMNLTRIVSPEQAAIKHVYDSIVPWQYLQQFTRVLDAGTGAGFPGIPLAVVLPEVHFTLCESIQKKARFVDSAVETLELSNVRVSAARAEDVALNGCADVIVARALAPVARTVDLFRTALKRGMRLLLYKGPDVSAELAEAERSSITAELLCRYDLPDALGSRTLVELSARRAPHAIPRKQAQASR